MIEKHIYIFLIGMINFVAVSNGGPLAKSDISKDAKWLTHIDMESLMESSFGELGLAKLKETIEEKRDSSKVSVDVDQMLSEVKSITAYGTRLDEDAADGSVLLLKTGDRFQALVNGFVAHQEMEEAESPLQRVEGKPYDTFLVERELYLAFPCENYALAGQSFEQIENAYAVIEGRADNLLHSGEKLLLEGSDSFFLLVAASGIGDLKNMPPQARMLQKTKGGQFAVGEGDGEFRARMVLTTADREVSLQLARIVEGLLALASFTQVENQNMLEVVQSVKVNHGADFVALDFAYPTAKILGLIESLSEMAEDKLPEEEETVLDEPLALVE